jgi:hypothetical protein
VPVYGRVNARPLAPGAETECWPVLAGADSTPFRSRLAYWRWPSLTGLVTTDVTTVLPHSEVVRMGLSYFRPPTFRPLPGERRLCEPGTASQIICSMTMNGTEAAMDALETARPKAPSLFQVLTPPQAQRAKVSGSPTVGN